MRNQPPHLTQSAQRDVEYMALRLAEKFNIDRYALEKELKYYVLNTPYLATYLEPEGFDPDDIEIEVTSYDVRYKGELVS